MMRASVSIHTSNQFVFQNRMISIYDRAIGVLYLDGALKYVRIPSI